MGSIWNGTVTISLFGQSHSPAIGVTVDGLPAGIPVDLEELQKFLNRRAPGHHAWATPRKEADRPEFLSGLKNGYTCGAPLTAIIRNTNTRSVDYAEIQDLPRPSHADYTARIKYGGYEDGDGGGHFSGRLTAPYCIAGGIILQYLKRQGIEIGAHLASIATVHDQPFDPVGVNKNQLHVVRERDFPILNPEMEAPMREAIEQARQEGDSVGGVIECAAVGVPAGLGDPMFDGLENRIARLVFAIPAVRGIEFGTGFEAAAMRGSAHNDSFYMDEGQVHTKTNHHGGILGGISSGMPILFRCAIKPTPSIARPQDTVRLSQMENAHLAVRGRHDPCIAPRAVPVVEAAMAIALGDALLAHPMHI
jgi:chorismate synthase